MWAYGIFTRQENVGLWFITLPENMGECYFYTTRKYGRVVFSLHQKMWGRGFFTLPENMDECYFHSTRKYGRVSFSRHQKMWANVFCSTRKYGRVEFLHYQKIWESGDFTLPENFCRCRVRGVFFFKMTPPPLLLVP